MVQSLNTKIDIVEDATSFLGLTNYGKIMIGDKAFEFYNSRDEKNYIQIPWNEVDYIAASVLFRGKWIPRYMIQTKHNGRYIFSSKNSKLVLRKIRDHIGSGKMFHSLTFFQVIKRGLKQLKTMRRFLKI
jgi:hypothetical protein